MRRWNANILCTKILILESSKYSLLLKENPISVYLSLKVIKENGYFIYSTNFCHSQ